MTRRDSTQAVAQSLQILFAEIAELAAGRQDGRQGTAAVLVLVLLFVVRTVLVDVDRRPGDQLLQVLGLHRVVRVRINDLGHRPRIVGVLVRPPGERVFQRQLADKLLQLPGAIRQVPGQVRQDPRVDAFAVPHVLGGGCRPVGGRIGLLLAAPGRGFKGSAFFDQYRQPARPGARERFSVGKRITLAADVPPVLRIALRPGRAGIEDFVLQMSFIVAVFLFLAHAGRRHPSAFGPHDRVPDLVRERVGCAPPVPRLNLDQRAGGPAPRIHLVGVRARIDDDVDVVGLPVLPLQGLHPLMRRVSFQAALEGAPRLPVAAGAVLLVYREDFVETRQGVYAEWRAVFVPEPQVHLAGVRAAGTQQAKNSDQEPKTGKTGHHFTFFRTAWMSTPVPSQKPALAPTPPNIPSRTARSLMSISLRMNSLAGPLA